MKYHFAYNDKGIVKLFSKNELETDLNTIEIDINENDEELLLSSSGKQNGISYL